MTLKSVQKYLVSFLKHYYLIIIIVLIIIIAAWTGYFVYTNLYQVSINPKELNPNEIIAKKQKVNLNQFNAINDRIIEKIKASEETLLNPESIKNPFE